MKRFLILAVLILSGCSTLGVKPVTNPPPATEPMTSATTAPAATEQPEVAEITDDRLVRFISSPEVANDLDTALQINALSGDKIMSQCILWVRAPETLRRASGLLNVRGALQIVPIKPTGVVSGIAEVRRVKSDIRSGALSARIAAKRAELAELRRDYKLACGPFLVDGGAAIGLFSRLIP